MNKIERRLHMATRLTPASERARYGEEWQSDIRSADSAGESAERISRGALRMALHLRVRQAGQLLLGRLGVIPAAFAWVLLAGLAVLSFLFGGIILLLGLAVTAVAVLVLARAGVQTHWSHFLLIGSMIIGTLSAAFVWWTVGLSIDAADSFTPEPSVVQWTGTAIVLFLLSGVGVLVSAIVAATTQARRRSS